MSEFFDFWSASFREALSSAWGVVGGVELMITILGTLAYDLMKDSGPAWLRAVLRHPVLSSKWRLFTIFLAWFMLTMLLIAPYRQFQNEHAAKMRAETDAETARKDAKIARDELASLSPSGQQQEIARLRSVVKKFEEKDADEAAREWPPLSAEQIEEWVEALRPYHIKSFWIYRLEEVESKKLYLSLKKIGKRLSFDVEVGAGWWGDDDDQGGIEVDVFRDNPIGPIIVGLLTKGGYRTKLAKENPIAQQGNVCFAIGERK